MALRVYLTKEKLKPVVHEAKHKKRANVLLKIQLGIVIVLFLSMFVIQPLVQNKKKTPPSLAQTPPQVQGASTIDQTASQILPTETPVPQPTSTPFPTSTATPTPTPLAKSHYNIVIIGDSMIDTMSPYLGYLDTQLRHKYPSSTFSIYDFGRGSENAEQALKRFTDPFTYQNRTYQSMSDIKPDIIIVGSYAYNPLDPYDRDAHWLGLTRVIQAAQKITSNVYILAEIAPLRAKFGIGPNGIDWPEQKRVEHSGHIMEQLQNAVGLSSALQVPIVNMYEKSLSSGGNEGEKKYVSQSDGIHPSKEGHEFTAKTIVDTILFRE